MQKIRTHTIQTIRVSDIYILLSLIVIVFWNYAQEISRFLLVLSPWLWLFLLTPFMRAAQAGKLDGPRKAALALLVFVALTPVLYVWSMTIHNRQNHVLDVGQYPQLWPEYRHAFTYIRDQLQPGAPIGCTFEAPVYLYTGHPTLHINLRSIRTVNNQAEVQAFGDLMRSVDHYGVRYLLLEPQLVGRIVSGPNAVMVQLIRQFPQRFRLVMVTPQQMLALYEILPAS